MNNECPLYNSVTAAKYAKNSDWCVACVEETLADQRKSDTSVQHPQVIDG